MTWAFALALKPFALLALFALAYGIGAICHPLLPDGMVKRLLYDRSLQKRHPWKFGLGFLFAGWAAIFIASLAS